jgi:hypothetical protein
MSNIHLLYMGSFVNSGCNLSSRRKRSSTGYFKCILKFELDGVSACTIRVSELEARRGFSLARLRLPPVQCWSRSATNRRSQRVHVGKTPSLHHRKHPELVRPVITCASCKNKKPLRYRSIARLISFHICIYIYIYCNSDACQSECC